LLSKERGCSFTRATRNLVNSGSDIIVKSVGGIKSFLSSFFGNSNGYRLCSIPSFNLFGGFSGETSTSGYSKSFIGINNSLTDNSLTDNSLIDVKSTLSGKFIFCFS
jgi:hypothetical protein